jgi:hypothetical protein
MASVSSVTVQPTPATRVVHVKQQCAGSVYIGRPSVYGNPYQIGRHGTRGEVIRKHKIWLYASKDRLQQARKLQGKVLVCYCHPLACHGDTLAHVADMPQDEFEGLLLAATDA